MDESAVSPETGCQHLGSQVVILRLPELLWQCWNRPMFRLDWRGESRQRRVSGPISIPWHFPVCQENRGRPVNKVLRRRREKGGLNVKCKTGIVRLVRHQVRILMQIYSRDQTEEGNDKRVNNWMCGLVIASTRDFKGQMLPGVIICENHLFSRWLPNLGRFMEATGTEDNHKVYKHNGSH